MLKRILIFALGLTSLSLGIALITNAHLGTSSISSFAYVLSMGTGLTMGLFVFLTNVFFFSVQTAIDFGEIRGLREGTVAAALISGPTAKFFLHGWGRLMPHHGVID